MPASCGWKFLKRGQCAECSEAEAMLFVPVLEGAQPVEDRWWVTGEHVPHFKPVCRKCTGKFELHVLCSDHRLPLRIVEAVCQLCFKRPALSSAKTR